MSKVYYIQDDQLCHGYVRKITNAVMNTSRRVANQGSTNTKSSSKKSSSTVSKYSVTEIKKMISNWIRNEEHFYDEFRIVGVEIAGDFVNFLVHYPNNLDMTIPYYGYSIEYLERFK